MRALRIHIHIEESLPARRPRPFGSCRWRCPMGRRHAPPPITLMPRQRLDTLASPAAALPSAGTLLVNGRWWIGKQLGAGSFATVHEAKDTVGSMGDVAVKIFEDVFRNEDAVRSVHDEIVILEQLKHPRCCKLVEVFCDDDNSRVYAFIEQGGQEITDLVPSNGFSETTARVYFDQILQGLAYLHRNCVVHRDIKLANILIKQLDEAANAAGNATASESGPCDVPGDITIVGFGCASISSPGQDRSTVCGSLSYMPPEMASAVSQGSSNAQHDGRAVDIWCSGVCLFAMLTGRLPFRPAGASNMSRQRQMRSEIRGIVNGVAAIEIPDTICPSAKHLLQSMLHTDPQQRLTLASVRNHPWLSGKAFSLDASLRSRFGCCGSRRGANVVMPSDDTVPRPFGSCRQDSFLTERHSPADEPVGASDTFRTSFAARLSASQVSAFRQASDHCKHQYKQRQRSALRHHGVQFESQHQHPRRWKYGRPTAHGHSPP